MVGFFRPQVGDDAVPGLITEDISPEDQEKLAGFEKIFLVSSSTPSTNGFTSSASHDNFASTVARQSATSTRSNPLKITTSSLSANGAGGLRSAPLTRTPLSANSPSAGTASRWNTAAVQQPQPQPQQQIPDRSIHSIPESPAASAAKYTFQSPLNRSAAPGDRYTSYQPQKATPLMEESSESRMERARSEQAIHQFVKIKVCQGDAVAYYKIPSRVSLRSLIRKLKENLPRPFEAVCYQHPTRGKVEVQSDAEFRSLMASAQDKPLILYAMNL